MINRDIIVIGTSLGGIEALRVLVKDLPSELPAAIFIVLHTAASSPNVLHTILGRAGPLPASTASNWKEFRRGHIYIAPADHHLLLERSGYMRTTRGPKENRFRPAIDPLGRSAASAFGPRAIGVILTGSLDDGTAGLWAIKERGGVAVVQHPDEAIAPAMPLNALSHVEVDHCIGLKEMAPLLAALSSEPAEEKGGRPVSEEMEMEVKIAREENALDSGIRKWGKPSLYACPECHGVLLQLKEGSNIRFRCHTGHAYSVEALLAEFNEQTEATLWNAIRSIEETVLLMRRMAEQLKNHQHNQAAESMLSKASEAQTKAELLRQTAIAQQTTAPVGTPSPAE